MQHRSTLLAGPWCIILGLLAFSGCASDDPLKTALDDVQSGRTDTLTAEGFEITNGDLQRIARLPSLRVLQLENCRTSDAGLECLIALTNLEHLRLRGAQVGDAGLRSLCRLKSLKVLNLPHAQFSDSALESLAELPQLELLRFGSPNVTDDGMSRINKLSQLRFVHLIDVPITDAGLLELGQIAGLESLYIDGGRITGDGIESFIKQRPDVHFHIDQQHHDRDPKRHPH